jgi:hypothetical protein
MPDLDQLPTEDSPQLTLDPADTPTDDLPEWFATIREIGVMGVALVDLLSAASNVRFRLQDSSPTLNLSAAAIEKALGLAILPELQGEDAALSGRPWRRGSPTSHPGSRSIAGHVWGPPGAPSGDARNASANGSNRRRTPPGAGPRKPGDGRPTPPNTRPTSPTRHPRISRPADPSGDRTRPNTTPGIARPSPHRKVMFLAARPLRGRRGDRPPGIRGGRDLLGHRGTAPAEMTESRAELLASFSDGAALLAKQGLKKNPDQIGDGTGNEGALRAAANRLLARNPEGREILKRRGFDRESVDRMQNPVY